MRLPPWSTGLEAETTFSSAPPPRPALLRWALLWLPALWPAHTAGSTTRKRFPGFLSRDTGPHRSRQAVEAVGWPDKAKHLFPRTAPQKFRFLLPFFQAAREAPSLAREAHARAHSGPYTWLPNREARLPLRSTGLPVWPPLPPWLCFARECRWRCSCSQRC